MTHKLAKTSELADGELTWLQERELSSLNSTASSASQEVTKRQEVFKSGFTDLMRQVGDLLTQVEQIFESPEIVSHPPSLGDFTSRCIMPFLYILMGLAIFRLGHWTRVNCHASRCEFKKQRDGPI